MNMRRRNLMNSVARRHLGLAYIEGDGTDTGGGGGTESAGGGNTGGNNGNQSQSGGGTPNNASTALDPNAFWNPPAPSADNGSSASGGAGGSGTQSENQDAGKAFADKLGAVSFSHGLSDGILKELAEGKVEGFNGALQAGLKESVQQSVMLTAELMQKNNANLLAQVKELMQGTLGNRDNKSALSEAIPSYKNPAVAPIVDKIFEQAMALNKNDRSKALAQTKEMMKLVGSSGGEDFGLDRPPADPHGSNLEGSKSLLDDLLGRN